MKVGDKVRRKAEFRKSSGWAHGDQVVTIKHIEGQNLQLDELGAGWELYRFEPVTSVSLDDQIKDYETQLAALKVTQRQAFILTLLDELKDKVQADPTSAGYSASNGKLRLHLNVV